MKHPYTSASTTPINLDLQAAAHDLAAAISVVSARLRHNIGIVPDSETIARVSELADSLLELHNILQDPLTPKCPLGRPPKLKD